MFGIITRQIFLIVFPWTDRRMDKLMNGLS